LSNDDDDRDDEEDNNNDDDDDDELDDDVTRWRLPFSCSLYVSSDRMLLQIWFQNQIRRP
jgi:hypothetical protein